MLRELVSEKLQNISMKKFSNKDFNGDLKRF